MDHSFKERRVRERLRQIMLAGPFGQVALDGAAGTPRVLDLRELAAPEPLEQALLHMARLEVGQSFIAWTPRLPQPLLQRVRERGFHCIFESAPDGSALVYIERP